MNTFEHLPVSVSVVLALATTACDERVIIDDFGTAGYAVVSGSVPEVSGGTAAGAVFVACGLDEPTWFGSDFPVSDAGTYRAELEWPMLDERELLEARDWKAICRVAYPSNRPPYAQATDTVLFAPTKAAAIETTIDLVSSGP